MRSVDARIDYAAMAQFVFESDLHSLLQLDAPIPNAPVARWQRKVKETKGPAPSPMRAANKSHSAGRTPGRTPGKSNSKTMAKVAELKGHTAQVLSLTMSPDGATVASAAADETLRLWHCFELDPALQRERKKASVAKSSLIHQGIH
ncbi:Cell division cycle protein 20-like protein [Microtus ochrogaster]|uniref:Cell division cycle protein 20-like protein n=1 Tax=Microtus ochrogaster TaxID=79684 RepID=A0A8J6G6P0_MICOH|nr:Cell division cycle protein 20-like protein [Microtus ochrogaster]